MICSFTDCRITKLVAKGLCSKHYRATRPPCTLGGCTRPQHATKMCYAHWYRTKNGISLDAPVRYRAAEARWHKNCHGYIVKTAKAGGKHITLIQHREVMREKIGRDLLPHENVHHINGVRDDNRPENLELWTKSQPAGQRVEDKIAWAIEFLAEYGYTVDRPLSIQKSIGQ